MGRGVDVGKWALWRRRIEEFERGTASVAEYCRRVGVAQATFYLWRRKVKAEAQTSTSISTSTSPSTSQGPRLAPPGPQSATALSFLPVQIAATRTVEVVLANGTRVLIPSGDHEALRTVLQLTAEDRSC